MLLFWKKANAFHKYCPAAIWLSVCAKFVLKYKLENSIIWKLTNAAICLIAAIVSISFDSKKKTFYGLKISRTCSYKGICSESRDGIFCSESHKLFKNNLRNRVKVGHLGKV